MPVRTLDTALERIMQQRSSQHTIIVINKKGERKRFIFSISSNNNYYIIIIILPCKYNDHIIILKFINQVVSCRQIITTTRRYQHKPRALTIDPDKIKYDASSLVNYDWSAM